MAEQTNHIVKLWKGSYSAYSTIKEKDAWTRYIVSMPGSTGEDEIVEYYGDKRIQPYQSGSLYPVKQVCPLSKLGTLTLSAGDRYLVGPDGAFKEDGSLNPDYEGSDGWYVVIIYGDNKSERYEPEIKKLGNLSVRIESLGMKEYFLKDNKLVSYDDIDGGLY